VLHKFLPLLGHWEKENDDEEEEEEEVKEEGETKGE
jgi:hypothetical protein